MTNPDDMMIQKKFLLFLLPWVIGLQLLSAQRSVATSGGDISGASGTVSFTVGQVVYLPVLGESGSIYTGVQQPSTTTIVRTEELFGDICVQVYPNPFSQFFFLTFGDELSETELDKFSFRLYGMDGRLYVQSKVSGRITLVDPGHSSEGVFILQIIHQHHQTTSIKLVKSN